ncbi:hypothetical protein [Solidesulfovibrio carbinolicus]|uniref:hypothetical protein n=1 Tax=Solidesulfovibrio carbinolicus TaxID=296842 RepID=UPI001012C463|nr:hypothetical protein [Solidesulfovibrio carbinolicus]
MKLKELKSASPLIHNKLTNEERKVYFDEIRFQMLMDLENIIKADENQHLTAIATSIKHIITQAMVYSLQVTIKELDRHKQLLLDTNNKSIKKATLTILDDLIIPLVTDSHRIFKEEVQ